MARMLAQMVRIRACHKKILELADVKKSIKLSAYISAESGYIYPYFFCQSSYVYFFWHPLIRLSTFSLRLSNIRQNLKTYGNAIDKPTFSNKFVRVLEYSVPSMVLLLRML